MVSYQYPIKTQQKQLKTIGFGYGTYQKPTKTNGFGYGTYQQPTKTFGFGSICGCHNMWAIFGP